MILLEEKRGVLFGQIEAIDSKLTDLQKALYAQPMQAPAPIALSRKAAPAGKGARQQRGALREQIMEALQAAGSNGATVKALSAMLGISTAHVHTWFSSNLKKVAGLKKVAPSHYVLNGGASKAPAPAKVSKGKAAKPAVVAKAAKHAAKKAKRAGRAPRGAMKEKIVAALTAAGSEGISIKDLAAKIGANYRNVYVWFVTTGKGIAGITKVGPARYKLQAA